MSSTLPVRDDPPRDGSAWQARKQAVIPCSACQASLAVIPVARWDVSHWQLVWDCQECGKPSHHASSESTFSRLSAEIGPWSLAQELPGAPFRLVGE